MSRFACTALITRDALPISGSSVDVVPPGGVTVYSGWKRTSASTPTMLPSRYPIRTPPPILWDTCWAASRSEEHTSELQSRLHLVCRLLLENKKHYLIAPFPQPSAAAD